MPQNAKRLADYQQRVSALGRLADRVCLALEKTGPFFRNVIDPCCVATVDYFLLVNSAWTAVLGWSQEEMKGRPWMDFLHPDDLEKTSAMVAKQSAGGLALLFTNRYRCKDGSYRLLEWSAPAWDAQGLTYAIARDVTGRGGGGLQ